jgi:hypothetical protein
MGRDWQFLSLHIRPSLHMVDDSRHRSLVILDEVQLRPIELNEEMGFRFGIKSA